MMQRIQKIMAYAGIDSRRKCEEMILEKRVVVNGKTATLGMSADTEKDVIKVDGVRIREERKVYIALYKPKGYVTTVSDIHASRTVMDLARMKERIFPVGRLDEDSEGLLLMTNDGEFANKVAHPRNQIEKTYIAKLRLPLDISSEKRLEKGVYIDGIKTWPAKVRNLGKSGRLVEITIHEGRHKIVKRMFKAVGNYVLSLTRTRIGDITLHGLTRGRYRSLSKTEIEQLTR